VEVVARADLNQVFSLRPAAEGSENQGEKQMATVTKRLGVVVLASVAGCLLIASPLLAQQPAANPGMGNPQMPLLNGFNQQAQGLGFGANLQRQGFITSVNQPFQAFNSQYGSGYGLPAVTGVPSNVNSGNMYQSPWSGWGWYDSNAIGETLRGMASVINAEGTYLMQVQDSRIRYEQWQQARLDTRRRSIEEFLYERALVPTGEDLRESMQRYELRIAMNSPPLNEVLSGESLNTIFRDLRTKLASGAKGQPMPLDPAILKQINLTSNSGGNLGVLKNVRDGGTLRWPLALQGEAYQEEVKRLNQRAAEALKLAEFKNQVDAGTIRDMMEDVNRLRAKISANINDLTPSQYSTASRFLKQLEDAFKALQQPDIGDYLGQKYMAQGKNVGDLLDFMMRKGLTFAPAVNGDEGAYQALHTFLVGFANTLQGSQTTQGSSDK
jgi:hypothetical protein